MPNSQLAMIVPQSVIFTVLSHILTHLLTEGLEWPKWTITGIYFPVVSTIYRESHPVFLSFIMGFSCRQQKYRSRSGADNSIAPTGLVASTSSTSAAVVTRRRQPPRKAAARASAQVCLPLSGPDSG